LNSDLAEGLHVILRTQGHERLELTTRAVISGVATSEGTFLNAVDFASLNDKSLPKLRLYTWHDTFEKLRSAGGVALLLPALLALLAAVAGILFLVSSQGQPPSTTVADQAQTIVAWATQPGTVRASQAQLCLLHIEGHIVPAVTIPGVTCAPSTIPWWRSALTGSLVTGVITVLAAIVGILSLRSRYRFGKKPVAGG
jgi:hypothetical protein